MYMLHMNMYTYVYVTGLFGRYLIFLYKIYIIYKYVFHMRIPIHTDICIKSNMLFDGYIPWYLVTMCQIGQHKIKDC